MKVASTGLKPWSLALLWACTTPLCRADLLLVTLDTTALMGHPAQPFYFEAQLNDGSGTDDANNTAVLSGFDFGGGMPGLSLSTIGGASGSLDTSVVLTDSSFFNQFYQEFLPGTKLSFQLSLSTAVDTGPQPDRFTFSILDCSLAPIPTSGPANEFLGIDIDASRTVETYAGDSGGTLPCTGGPGIAVPGPQAVVVPEPASHWLLAPAAIALYRRRRISRPRA